MECLYRVKDGKATITDEARTIWYLKDIIEKYGEEIAVKIFTVYHRMADLSKNNPFANVSEIEKLEVVIRATCPEIVLEVDWNDPLILEGIELTQKLYETMAYRKYLTSKIVYDKTQEELRNTEINLSKEFGNSGEITKALNNLTNLDEVTKKFYNEFLEEQGTKKIKGRGSVSTHRKSNTPKDLE